MGWYDQITDAHGWERPALKNGYNDGIKTKSGEYMILNGPPESGNGIYVVHSTLQGTIDNTDGTENVEVEFFIGVKDPSENNKPMYPYLGVVHMRSPKIYFVPRGQMVQVVDERLDVVDNKLQQDQPIPGWPAWKLNKASGKPYPTLLAQAHVVSGSAIIKNVMFFGIGGDI
jgi:hypothetical protein